MTNPESTIRGPEATPQSPDPQANPWVNPPELNNGDSNTNPTPEANQNQSTAPTPSETAQNETTNPASPETNEVTKKIELLNKLRKLKASELQAIGLTLREVLMVNAPGLTIGVGHLSWEDIANHFENQPTEPSPVSQQPITEQPSNPAQQNLNQPPSPTPSPTQQNQPERTRTPERSKFTKKRMATAAIAAIIAGGGFLSGIMSTITNRPKEEALAAPPPPTVEESAPASTQENQTVITQESENQETDKAWAAEYDRWADPYYAPIGPLESDKEHHSSWGPRAFSQEKLNNIVAMPEGAEKDRALEGLLQYEFEIMSKQPWKTEGRKWMLSDEGIIKPGDRFYRSSLSEANAAADKTARGESDYSEITDFLQYLDDTVDRCILVPLEGDYASDYAKGRADGTYESGYDRYVLNHGGHMLVAVNKEGEAIFASRVECG